MGKILKYEEIKKNQHVEYSESYKVRFWIKEGEFWKQRTETYYAKRKDEQEYVSNRWKDDYKGQDVKIIAVNYQ